MKLPRLIALLGVVGCSSAEVFAQDATLPQVRDIARVLSVRGVCEACPDGHSEMRRTLFKGAMLETNDWVHCVGAAHGKAVYLAGNGKEELTGGQFELAGSEWEPVGSPGAPEKQKKEQRRFGTQASAAPTVHYAEAAVPNHKLSRDVHTALARTKGISTTNIKIRARSGAIVLEGTVPEQSQIPQAAEVARGVTGVTSVKNALTLRPPGN
ncbi:BON domain-containing protein [Paraburkholderia atlantica]|uniref:BON domain-containing protein n=1 Tax=Paraburkholderia atlantica TaxID=2654982 RepID=UPI0017FBC27C|nr:BON domain-containing protein [Paraburkholderia atlantica]MBB5417071.1 osmotically-inducible protein OsmY [Paraburkholderia atlantica]